MTEMENRKRHNELTAGIRGIDLDPTLAVWRIVPRMGQNFQHCGKDTLHGPTLLRYPDKGDGGDKVCLRPCGANLVHAALRGAWHINGEGSGAASIGVSCEGSGSILMSEQSRYTAGPGKPASKLDTRWYFHDQ